MKKIKTVIERMPEGDLLEIYVNNYILKFGENHNDVNQARSFAEEEFSFRERSCLECLKCEWWLALGCIDGPIAFKEKIKKEEYEIRYHKVTEYLK